MGVGGGGAGGAAGGGGEPGEKPSKHGRDQLHNSSYTWSPSCFFENQHEGIPRCVHPVWSSIQLHPLLIWLNLEFSGKRQRANCIRNPSVAKNRNRMWEVGLLLILLVCVTDVRGRKNETVVFFKIRNTPCMTWSYLNIYYKYFTRNK